MPVPKPTPLFHITAIDNLAGLAASGSMLAKNQLVARGIVTANIAYASVQGHRAIKIVPIPPGGSLHDYVPFHFAPRSPMLSTINQGNVEGCDYRQDDIVHLVTSAEEVVAAGAQFVFTNYHAVKAFAEFFDDLDDLDNIDWELFFEAPRLEGYCQYWHSPYTKPRYAQRMETRQAEFLVRDALPLAAITQIGVRNENMEVRVRAALAGAGWQPHIVRHPGWYY